MAATILAAFGIWWFSLREGPRPPDPNPGKAGAALPGGADPTSAADEDPVAHGPTLEAKGMRPAPARQPAKAPSTAVAPEGGRTLRGRVLDDRRRPVLGAEVSVSGAPGAPRRAPVRSGSGGRFEILGVPRAERYGSLLVRARHGQRAGLAGLRTGPGTQDVIDIGDVVLGPGHALEVQVQAAGGGVLAGARVFLEGQAGWYRGVVAERRAGADGVARFEHVAEGSLRVLAAAAGRGRAAVALILPQREPGPLVLTLGAERDVSVLVTDADSQAPVVGATLLVEEVLERSGMGPGQIVPYVPLSGDLVTDDAGRTRLHGIGPDDALQVHALAAGYSRPGNMRIMQAAKIVDGEIRIQLRRLRRVTWPLADDNPDAPPEGTSLETAQARGAMTAPAPASVRIEDGHIVAEGCDAGVFHLLVIAPDGAYAQVMALPGSNVGRSARFQRPRKVVVIVQNADGSPAEGVYVSLRNQGNMVLEDPVATGPGGRVTFDAHTARLVDAFVASTPTSYGGRAVGALDLREHGGTLRVSRPAPGQRVDLSITIDGEARLPRTYTLRFPTGAPLDLVEDPEHGSLSFSLPADLKGKQRGSFAAEGFLGATVEIPAAGAGAVVHARIVLMRGGYCLLRIKPPADGQQRVSLHPEGRKGPPLGAIRAGRAGPQSLPSEDGWLALRFGPLEPGTYRAVEALTRVQSGTVEIREGEDARLAFDLSRVTTIQGVVEVPEGFEPSGAQVLMSGDGLYVDPYPSRSHGAYVGKDGRFRIRVPGTQRVRLTPRHPTLVPAAVGGSVEVLASPDDVHLRLAQGSAAVFRLDPPPASSSGPAARSQAVEVLLYADEARGEPLRRMRPMRTAGAFTIAGLSPGTWTMVIDRRGHVPVVLEKVVVGVAETDLGTVTTPPGATVHLKLLLKEGEAAPRIFASALAKGPFKYSRYVNSNGEREVLLAGLGAGTFELRAGAIRSMGAGRGGAGLHKTINSDGHTPIVMALDLR